MAGLAELGLQVAHDFRYAWRSLKRTPGFALAGIVTIGLGVGINTGIFSIVNAVVLGDFPAGAADELVVLGQEVQGVPRASNNYSQFTRNEYEAFRDQSSTLSGVLAYGRMWDATLGGEIPRTIVATPVSCNYFDVLQRPPQRGGSFAPAHCASGGDAAVAVITHDLWMEKYAGDESVVGDYVTLNGSDYRILGIAPPGFEGVDIDRPSVFVPIEAREQLRPDRNFFDDDTLSWLNLVGRLRPGTSIEQVEAEWSVIAAQLDQARPGRSSTVSVERARRLSAPQMRVAVIGASAIVMLAFGLVLIVACSNVANLMLARADLKLRDTAIRASLGATRRRLVRQFMTESVLLAGAGGLLGALLAVCSVEALLVAAMSALPTEAGVFLLQIEPRLDVRVFAFAAGVSLLAGIGFGIAPAFAASRPCIGMSNDRDAGVSGRRGTLQGGLVGAQVAVSMILVVATALLLRGLFQTMTVDPDFDHENLIVAGADLGAFGYSQEQAVQFQTQAIEEIRALPGVVDVAQALIMPLEPRSRAYDWRLPEEAEDQARSIEVNNVSANYFAATGIPIVRGRAFSEAEVDASQPTAAILSESTARAFWPDESALGKTLISGFGQTVEVVGIARDIETTIGNAVAPYIYTPAVPAAQPEMQLVVRSALVDNSLVELVADVYRRLDPRLPARVQPFDQNLAFWVGISSVVTSIALGLGGLALALAAVGVYGVMSTVVGRRVREIGIRLALGAGRADVLALMLRKSMRPVAIGAAIGALACFGVARLLAALLFGVGALDPYALSGAVAAVLGAGFIASAIPARRAMNTDPMSTLRCE